MACRCRILHRMLAHLGAAAQAGPEGSTAGHPELSTVLTFSDHKALFHAGFQGGLLITKRISKHANKPLEVLTPWRWKYQHRDLPEPIIYGGKCIDSYLALKVTEYVDTETGEIFPAKDLLKSKRIREIHAGEFSLMRSTLLAALRPEVRPFAEYVLKFRNARCGITPGINTLATWYAELHGKRASNVRRLIPALYKGGILAGESLASPLFQYGRGTRGSRLVPEDARAQIVRHGVHQKRRAALAHGPQRLKRWEPEDDPLYMAISPWRAGSLRGLTVWLEQRRTAQRTGSCFDTGYAAPVGDHWDDENYLTYDDLDAQAANSDLDYISPI